MQQSLKLMHLSRQDALSLGVCIACFLVLVQVMVGLWRIHAELHHIRTTGSMTARRVPCPQAGDLARWGLLRSREPSTMGITALPALWSPQGAVGTRGCQGTPYEIRGKGASLWLTEAGLMSCNGCGHKKAPFQGRVSGRIAPIA